MVLIDFSVNYLGILIATFISFIFGWLWYGPLFGRIWARENKIKPTGEMPLDKLAYHFMTNLLLVLGIALLFSGTFLNGIILVLVLWAGIFLSTRLSSMIWMKQSWNLFSIDITYNLINLILIVITLSFF